MIDSVCLCGIGCFAVDTSERSRASGRRNKDSSGDQDIDRVCAQEYFDQNPVSLIGLVLVKQGEATQLHGLSGNIQSLKLAFPSVADLCASGSWHGW